MENLLRFWPFARRINRWPLDSLTKASDAEVWCFLWSEPERMVGQTNETPVIEDAIALIMTSLQCPVEYPSEMQLKFESRQISFAINLLLNDHIISEFGTEHEDTTFLLWANIEIDFIIERNVYGRDFGRFDLKTPFVIHLFRLVSSLHWHHNDHDGASNHQPHGC